jgi:hypothetical protein
VVQHADSVWILAVKTEIRRITGGTTLTMGNDTELFFDLPCVARKKVTAAFEGGAWMLGKPRAERRGLRRGARG